MNFDESPNGSVKDAATCVPFSFSTKCRSCVSAIISELFKFPHTARLVCGGNWSSDDQALDASSKGNTQTRSWANHGKVISCLKYEKYLEGRRLLNPEDRHDWTLTHYLRALEERATGEVVTIAEIEEILKGRGFAALSLILCIPFIQPIPLPGVSVVFGVLIMALGLRLAFGESSGLPKFVKGRTVEAATLRKLLHGAEKIFSYVEKLFRPRFSLMLQRPMLNFVGVSIVLSGFALSLPLPPVILFSNSLPAWSIIFLSLGHLERDGVVVLIGHILTIATWFYFILWWEVVKYGLLRLVEYLWP